MANQLLLVQLDTVWRNQSAVPVELLLDRLVVLVQRAQNASTEERSRCWSPDFRKAEALRTLSG